MKLRLGTSVLTPGGIPAAFAGILVEFSSLPTTTQYRSIHCKVPVLEHIMAPSHGPHFWHETWSV